MDTPIPKSSLQRNDGEILKGAKEILDDSAFSSRLSGWVFTKPVFQSK